MYKILSILGARPHFVKAAYISKAIEEDPQIEEILLHTGQHYDHNLSQLFFDELGLQEPKYNLGVGSLSHLQQMGKILMALDDIIDTENPDMVIVYGDTNTTAAAAIAAAKKNIPLTHVEAGLREFDKTIPEEINKLLTDAVADIYCSPTKTGVDNLAQMGITKNVFLTGDVGIDLIYNNLDKIDANNKILDQYNLSPKQYYFVTCHRAANTDDPENLFNILSTFQELDAPIIFPMHPRTKQAIEKYDCAHFLAFPHIHVMPPIGFWDTQALIRKAKMCITDSGGVIKESYFHKVPAIIIDKQSEWIETIREGWNHIAGPDKEKILYLAQKKTTPAHHSNCLGNGKAGIKIIKLIKQYLNDQKQTSTHTSPSYR